MDLDYTDALKAFDAELSTRHMRGQWQFAAPPKEGQAPVSRNEPRAAGIPYLWRWAEIEPLIAKSCEALPSSFTARRSLAFKNPELPRCTAHTMQMSVQVIRPGEIAWAHRHSMAAIRFVIKGNDQLYTVVDGIAYGMADNDLVLTPGWSWHDHHNDSDEVALWLDVLDVPLVGGLNLGFYEELGEITQPIRNHCDSDCRYAWREMEPALRSLDGQFMSDTDGTFLTYVNRTTQGPTLPTLNCQVQRLPPGFSGRLHRRTSSAVYFAIHGQGATEAAGKTMEWSQKDAFVVPNWTWHRLVNRSKSEEALLFRVTDVPVIEALGLYREETD